jgi:uncharacterized protein DUF6431
MVIVVDCGDDVQQYVAHFAGWVVPHPATCPHCAVADRLVGHGSYPRTVSAPARALAIRVRRLRCTACGRTVALLPAFCLPFRHYSTATMQTVLALRVEGPTSWSRIRRRFLPSDLPTTTTCREWVDAFARASTAYLPALLRQLATWVRRSVTLEVALADLGTASSAAAQLIAAVPHLLGWLSDAGHLIAAGSRRWLATLWQWGNGRKLGRVV